ncbi:hypothetical protein CRM22_004234 [Opisthorchis felineus]|uniref:Uncharacterized protein n=1 Tax=Opisthorchis felineus TaxID=147828 RepID=A0A4S2LX71_OPIFE|nr:hypothetical protein CRM22_004234 [Opisthorchis felineus]
MMASGLRAEKSGFAREVQEKLKGKFDDALAARTLKWIRLLPAPAGVPNYFTDAVQKIPADIETVGMEDYAKYLNDGLVLGYLMACLNPKVTSQLGSVKTWQLADNPVFETSRRRDRIGQFLRFLSEYGVDASNQFQTDQLYESTNLVQVAICLSQLGVEAQTKPDFTGPRDFWMQKHQEHRREFTEEQLRSGSTVIGLQMGTTAGANASGVSFGSRRHITDTF